jgi:RND superfamily putative drug exporter
MASFVFSDLRMIGQFGTTVGIGLLFDTLIVRSLMTPSIAALLGRWFWWPQRLTARPHAVRTVESENVSPTDVVGSLHA